MAVELRRQRTFIDGGEQVLREDVSLEMGHRSGLRGGQVGGVAEHEDVVFHLRTQGVFVGGNEVEFISEARAFDRIIALVGRDGDKQIVGHLTIIPGHDLVGLGVYRTDIEVRREMDVFAFEKVPQKFGGLGLGEGSGQRGHEVDFDFAAHSFFGEPPVGEEGKFQRCDGALDRHFRDVDHQTPSLPRLQVARQRHGSIEGVEIEDVPSPAVAGQSF